MKIHLALLAALSLCAPHARAQDEPGAPQSRLQQLIMAHGTMVIQQLSLETTAKKHPELAKEAKSAALAFGKSALGEGAKGVEAELAARKGKDWPAYQKELDAELRPDITTQDVSIATARDFLARLNKEAKGTLPENYGPILLSANPRYGKTPSAEMAEGWKQTFRSKGHAKANKVDLSFSVPASWSRREGERDETVQTFQSGAGQGDVVCSLNVVAMPAEFENLTKEELDGLFTEEGMKSMLPQRGSATYLSMGPATFAGLKGGMVIGEHTQKRNGTTFLSRQTEFHFIHKKSFITIVGGVSQSSDSKESLDAMHKKYLPVFKAIANSIVLNDQKD